MAFHTLESVGHAEAGSKEKLQAQASLLYSSLNF